jgi:hypothetical protein
MMGFKAHLIEKLGKSIIHNSRSVSVFLTIKFFKMLKTLSLLILNYV